MSDARDDPSHPDAAARWTWRICLWTLTFSLPAALLALALYGQEQALSVVLGAILGALNFLALARAALRLVRDADAVQTGRAAPLLATLRWPATALATAAILWYMPGRPEGLVAGVLIALLGLAAAGLQLQQHVPPDDHDLPDR